ncbi:MAG: von Willebrand factor type A domain-containing protein [Alphaproteobacteria bacterium]|nr:von Willebrand factor type A domain-containing protein [Alphaproteobacteria bacterium]
MSDLDREIAEHYEQLELDPAAMDRLLAMEAAAPRRSRRTWWVAGALSTMTLAAALLCGVGVLQLGTRGGAELGPLPSPEEPRGSAYRRATPVRDRNPKSASDGSLIIIKGQERRPPEGVYIPPGPPPRSEAPRASRPWTDTRVDPLSTFAADVDTAAWTRARTMLEHGQRPAPASVRVEEVVNAFPYDYRAPEDGVFAVGIEGLPSVYGADASLVRIGVQGRRVPPHLRKPVHLTFLVDVSGSMNGRPLELVRSGLKMLVGELRPDDTVAIATYAGGTAVVLQPTPGSERARILAALDGLRSGGSTSMASGIDLAYDLALSTYHPSAENRVIVASDGDANVGQTDPDALAARLRKAADRGITLTTIGVGGSVRGDQVMETLARKGDGQAFAVADERDAETVFVRGLTGTLQTLARDVKLQVAFDPGVVKRWRQVGYDNRVLADRDFRDDAVDAGEIGAGHQMTALYEVELHERPRGDVPMRLGVLRIRHEPPGAERGEATELELPLEGLVHDRFADASVDTRVATVAAGFASALQGQGPSLATLEDILPIRPEYREQDEELLRAIRQARALGM